MKAGHIEQTFTIQCRNCPQWDSLEDASDSTAAATRARRIGYILTSRGWLCHTCQEKRI